MKNFVQAGKTLTVTAPAGGVVSGVPVLVGAIFGIAAHSATEGEGVSINTEGVFTLPKAGGQAWSVGDALYFDATAGNFTKTAEHPRAGTATAAAASGDVTGDVRIGDVRIVAPAPAIADLAAITGGESPTEAEHNALRATLNSALAALRAANVISE